MNLLPRLSLILCLSWPVTLTAQQTPHSGYYSGTSTLYPYGPVYCKTDNAKGDCYGLTIYGVTIYLPLSAPLPVWRKWCEWPNPYTARDEWYQWEPRAVPLERQKYLGERVCYFEDRGAPKNINELKREP